MALDALLHRELPPWWERFLDTPVTVMAQTLHAQRQNLCRPQAQQLGMTAVCVSDTHNTTPTLPPGNLLIHAGDLTQSGTFAELQAQLDWLSAQPHEHKVVIAGNHDVILDERKATELRMQRPRDAAIRWGPIVYLQRSDKTLDFSNGAQLKLFGHPETRKQGNWAFQYAKGADAFRSQVRDYTDILVTHVPPQFHLDNAGQGDRNLLRELWRVKPKLHVFGHMHASHGTEILVYDRFEELYEEVCAGEAGMIALLSMLFLLLKMWFFGVDRNVKRTVLVNAAAVGGLEDKLQHEVQVVYL